MKTNLFQKPCPNCKAQIGTGLFSIREKIVRCPQCGELLTENPKRKSLGAFIAFLGFVLGIGGCYLLDISLLWGLLIFLISGLISIGISNLMIIKKDLVIRNKQTNRLSYIDQADWDEILKNTSGKQNDFEIVETL